MRKLKRVSCSKCGTIITRHQKRIEYKTRTSTFPGYRYVYKCEKCEGVNG